MNERVFVFKERTTDKYKRPMLYAFRESDIKTVQTQMGSQNCYLVVNGIDVQGSFDDLVNLLGDRVNIA